MDNVVHATKVTGTNIAAATFPDAEPLGMVLCAKTGAAAEKARCRLIGTWLIRLRTSSEISDAGGRRFPLAPWLIFNLEQKQ